MQFIPIVERVAANMVPVANLGWGARPGEVRPLYVQAGDRVTERSVEPEALGKFLVEIFDEWVRRDVGRVFVQMFDVTLGAHVGQYSLCVFSPTCGDAVALEHTGDLYSCDHFVEPDFKLGNIREEHMADLVGPGAAAEVWDGQARYAAEVLPRMQRVASMQWRVPEGPVCGDSGWRGWSELLVRGVQAVLRACRYADAHDGAASGAGTAAGGDYAVVCGGG